MRYIHVVTALHLYALLSPSLRFFRRNDTDPQREAAFDEMYAILSATYETVASLKPEWSESWERRHAQTLPPKFKNDVALPAATLDAVREMRFARQLLQRHRWRSVKHPLFDEIDPTAWASLQRRMQMVSPELMSAQDSHREFLREDEIEWLARAVEGYDKARLYIRTASREGEPVERQVANSAYVAVHLALQLSDRLIERQRYELADGE